MKGMGTSHGRDVHGGYAAALLAFALLAGCSEQPAAAEPQPAPAPDAQLAAQATDAAGDASVTRDANDAQVEAVIEDDASSPPSADKRALRESFAECLQAAGGVDPAMQDCIGNEYEYQDGRLNAAYAKLKRTLGDSEMAGLRTVQRGWIAERDARCVWDAKTEGSAQRLQANQCRLDATAVRAGELEAMLRGGGAGGGAVGAKTQIEANAALESGRMTLSAGDMRFALSAPSCRPVSEGLSVCEGNVQLTATRADGGSQTLRPAALYLNERATLYRGALAQRDRSASQSIIVSDVNGDGRDDLALWTGIRGSYGGASYDIHLFDATKKTFVRSAAFSELTVGRDGFFTIVDGRIRTTSKSGCCLHTEEFHVVEKNAPKLVERIVEDATGNRASPKRTVSKLVDGRMREVK